MEQFLYYLGQLLTAKGLKSVLSAIALLLSWLVGGVSQVALALFALVAADYALGFLFAWKTNTISRRKLKDGVFKFFTYGITIIVGNLLDIIFFHKSSVDYGCRNLIMVYLGVNEGLSVFRHLANFNVPLPAVLIQKLESYRDGFDRPKVRIETK